MRPTETLVVCTGEYHLIYDRMGGILPYSWFQKNTGSDGRVIPADKRDDGLVYVAGFKDKDNALSYGRARGFIDEKFDLTGKGAPPTASAKEEIQS